MSDRRPLVTVKPIGPRDQWHAFCEEPGCDWRQSPGEKTYTGERAKMHRAKHRADASAKCDAATNVYIGNQTPERACCWRMASHDGPHCGQIRDIRGTEISHEWPRAATS